MVAAGMTQGNVKLLNPASFPSTVLRDELPLPERPHLLSRASETAPESEGEQVMTLEELERRHIERVLDRLGGNQTAAAKVLGIGRKTLHRKIQEYGLEG